MSAFGLPKYEWFNVTAPAEYVAHVEINRPSKLNAFFEPMWLELGVVFNALSTNADVRAVVLTGAGPRGFCSGLDVVAAASSSALSSPAPKDPARHAFGTQRHIDEFQRCLTAVEECRKPVACVLHGISYGLAIDLSCAADVRMAAADARLCVKEVDIGIAADVGTLTRLPKVVGHHSWIKDVCTTARVFGADEALRVGYVSHVAPDKARTVQAALDWASLVASKSPVAVQGTKHLLNYSRDHSTAEGLWYTAVWNSAMLQTQDVAAAMSGGINKGRTPRFEKL